MLSSYFNIALYLFIGSHGYPVVQDRSATYFHNELHVMFGRFLGRPYQRAIVQPGWVGWFPVAAGLALVGGALQYWTGRGGRVRQVSTGRRTGWNWLSGGAQSGYSAVRLQQWLARDTQCKPVGPAQLGPYIRQRALAVCVFCVFCVFCFTSGFSVVLVDFLEIV